MHKGKLKTDFRESLNPGSRYFAAREHFGKTAQTIRAQRAGAPCWEQSPRVPIMARPPGRLDSAETTEVIGANGHRATRCSRTRLVKPVEFHKPAQIQ